jgi:hypothetical protein
MANTVFQTWPCQTWPCQLPGANVVASPKIPSLPAHWYAATSVKPTAPSKASAETTGRPSPARRLCPKSVHSTTIGSFKLIHYRLGGLRPMHPIGSPTNPRLGWKNDWFGGQKTRAPAGALGTHHADEQQSDDRPSCIAKSRRLHCARQFGQPERTCWLTDGL